MRGVRRLRGQLRIGAQSAIGQPGVHISDCTPHLPGDHLSNRPTTLDHYRTSFHQQIKVSHSSCPYCRVLHSPDFRAHQLHGMSNTQATLRQGVRSMLAALLEAPEASLEVAVDARNSSGSPLTTASGGAGHMLDLVASHSIFVIVSPPVCSPTFLNYCYVKCLSKKMDPMHDRCTQPVD